MRKREADPIEAERQALADQRAALADLQKQLAARVAAVQSREAELREAIGRARNGGVARSIPGVEPQLRAPSPLPPAAGGDLAAQTQALAERERAVASREAEVSRELARLAAKRDDPDGETDENAVAVHQRIGELEQREAALLRKVAELTEREKQLTAELASAREATPAVALPPAEPNAEQLAKIEARLAELRVAEDAFGRTREELSARSEAVAARERLVAERERELAEREDGWGNTDLHELESRLRRLEQQKTAAPPASGFSSGMRKLEQQGKRGPKPAS